MSDVGLHFLPLIQQTRDKMDLLSLKMYRKE